MEWKDWINRRIFVKLKDDSVYSGKVIGVDNPNSPVVFMTITDKFGETVCFPVDTIIKIVEENK